MSSYAAFTEELLLIKIAEEQQVQTEGPMDFTQKEDEAPPFKSQVPTLLKSRLKSALKFGLGAGLGTGVGMLAGEYALPKILPKTWTPGTSKLLGGAIGGLGAVGSLALWDAMRQAAKAEENALRDH